MKLAAMLLPSLAVILSCAQASAGVVYSNTTNFKGSGIKYSSGPATQLGDQIFLAGLDRSATEASVQLFNFGTAAGTFDATLRLFNVGSPVGSQLGTDLTKTGISALAGSLFTLTFAIPNVLVPNELVFTLEVSNQTAGLDLGLVSYDPPTIGSSNNELLIAKLGNSFTLASVGGTALSNPHFELKAEPVVQPVPEPASFAILGIGAWISGVGAAFRRRRETQPEGQLAA